MGGLRFFLIVVQLVQLEDRVYLCGQRQRVAASHRVHLAQCLAYGFGGGAVDGFYLRHTLLVGGDGDGLLHSVIVVPRRGIGPHGDALKQGVGGHAERGGDGFRHGGLQAEPVFPVHQRSSFADGSHGQSSLELAVAHVAHRERQQGFVALAEEARQVVGHHQFHARLHRGVERGHAPLTVVYKSLQPPCGDIVGHGEVERGEAVAVGRCGGSPEGEGAEVAPRAPPSLCASLGAPYQSVGGEVLVHLGLGKASVFRLYFNVFLDDGCFELLP